MSYDKISIVALFMAVAIPAVAFVVSRIRRLPATQLARVVWVFWGGVLFSAGSAATAQITAAESSLSVPILVATTSVAAVLIGPRVIILRRAKRRLAMPEGRELPPREPPTKTICGLELVNKGGGDQVPFERSGEAGLCGWTFCAANYYKWTLTLNITTDAGGLRALAQSKGYYAPWYSFNDPTPQSSTSTVDVNVVCQHKEGKCVADGRDGKDSDPGHFSSAVVVKATNDKASCVLNVELAAAVAGNVAIENIPAGFEAAGLKVGPKINMPNKVQDKKCIERSYKFECTRQKIIDTS